MNQAYLRIPIHERKVFTTGMIAQIVGCAPRTVSMWCDKGILPSCRLPATKDRRVTRENLIAFFKQNDLWYCYDQLQPPADPPKVVIANELSTRSKKKLKGGL